MAMAAVGERSKRHEEHHHHRSKRDGTRHRHKEGRDPEPAAASDAPDVEELRRARTEYYSRPVEERRRKSEKGMAQEAKVKAKSRKETAESSSRTQAHTRRSHGSGPKRRDEPREEEDEAEYVYSRPRDDGGREGAADSSKRRKDIGATRGQHEGDKRERASVSRSHTRRRRHKPSASVEPSQRLAEEDTSRTHRETTDEGLLRRTEQGKGEPNLAAQQPHRKRDFSRLARVMSTRDSAHAPATRPLLQRSNTTTRIRRASVAAPAAPTTADKPTPSPSPSKSHRKSTSIFSALFSSGPSAPEKPEKPEPPIECLTCATPVPPTKAAKLSCGHRMCHACLRRIFTLSVADPAHMPPRCCTAEHIPLRHVDKLLSDRFKAKWNKKYQEYSTRNRLYCPARGCGEWIKPAHVAPSASTGRSAGKCPRCKTRVCAACGGKWHGRRACADDEETRRLAAMAREEGWQRCFDCGALVELKEGCNHMTCRCTAEFCMLCGVRWKGCDCPWFNAPPEPLQEGDRLNHMVVPEVVRNALFGGGAPPHLQAHLHPHLPMQQPPLQQPPLQQQPRPPPAPPANADPRRRAQERADEALARRLQMQALDDQIAGRHANNDDEEPHHTVDVQVFGVGNAGQHHMNETYRVQPPAPAAAAAAPPPRPAVAGGWNSFGLVGGGGR